MYSLLRMVVFQPATLVYQRVRWVRIAKTRKKKVTDDSFHSDVSIEQLEEPSPPKAVLEEAGRTVHAVRAVCASREFLKKIKLEV